MKRKLLAIIIVLALAFALGACGKKDNDSVILDVVHENLKATEAEDVDRVMKTMHPKSPVYNSTKNMIGVIFNMFDVKYELVSVKLLEVKDEEAVVKFEQVTRKVSGKGAFKDNRIIGRHILKKYEGKWLLFTTMIDKVEYLK